MKGVMVRISGPVVTASGLKASMYDVVRVGKERLMGEVIQIDGDKVIIQVYEDTSGLKPGEPVENTGKPLTAELGPGMLGSIYDGIQRPLPELQKMMGDFIKRGAYTPGIDRKKKWNFKAIAKNNNKVNEGDVLGEVEESKGITHRILVPPGISGKVTNIKSGKFTVTEAVCSVDGKEITMLQEWPVRKPRPVNKKLLPEIPLVTGQRVLDALFPLAKGGIAAIPGPFGAGKCVTGSTTIYVDGQLMPIQEFYEANELQGRIVEENEHEKLIKLHEPRKVYTFNGKNIQQGEATHIYKGKASNLLEVKTRSGRKVRLTPMHKLFKLDKRLNIVETEAANITQGDFIISPRKLEIQAPYQTIVPKFECRIVNEGVVKKIIQDVLKKLGINKKQLAKKLGVKYKTLLNYYSLSNKPTLNFVQKILEVSGKSIEEFKTKGVSQPIRVPTSLNEEFAELLGYIMSGGMIKGKKTVCFFNTNKQLIKRFIELTYDLFGLKCKKVQKRNAIAAEVTSTPFARLLNQLGVPYNKKSRSAIIPRNVGIPKDLLNSPDSVIESFMRAYISCNSRVGKKELEIATASKRMQSGLCYLLLRLGILHKAGEKQVKGRNYYKVFIPVREAVKLAPYYDKKFYYNSTDIVPMTSALFKEILGETKMDETMTVKSMSWSSEKQGISTISYYSGSNSDSTSGSRKSVKTFQKAVRLIGAEQLKKLSVALDHVFCDEIIEIKKIEGVFDVYDITVPDTHNFIGGNIPMILHNTVSQQSLAKWSDADIVIYIGCGERGNEMTEVLMEFPELIDPRTNKPLMNRTVLIANTSNMPVAAREASIYTGITIAEYYRDMGYNVALMADSTSRWAEAMREISSRLEEMPGEEGYPAYLSSRIADFYERAGLVVPLGNVKNKDGKREGSISVIGAVSPPGGDFSEPVTQNTLRVVKAFWALDAKLAQRRHFPSINWLVSYSLYLNTLNEWFSNNVGGDWQKLINNIMGILQEESKLMEIVQLVGSDALPERQQVVLDVARVIRESFLQQNAFHDVDAYSPLKKTYLMMKTIMHYNELANNALDMHVKVSDIIASKSKTRISEVKFEADYEKRLNEIEKEMKEEFDSMIRKVEA